MIPVLGLTGASVAVLGLGAFGSVGGAGVGGGRGDPDLLG